MATTTTDAVDPVRNHPRKAKRFGNWRPGHWGNRRSPGFPLDVCWKCRPTLFWCYPVPPARCGCWIAKAFNRSDDERFGFVYLPLTILDSTSAWGEHPIGLAGIFVHCRDMKMPIFQTGARSGTWATAPLQREPALPYRILVVDDDPLIRRLNSEVLIYSGYQVDAAMASHQTVICGYESCMMSSPRR